MPKLILFVFVAGHLLLGLQAQSADAIPNAQPPGQKESATLSRMKISDMSPNLPNLAVQLKENETHIKSLLKQYRSPSGEEYVAKKRVGILLGKLRQGKATQADCFELLMDLCSLKAGLSPSGRVEDREFFRLILSLCINGDRHVSGIGFSVIGGVQPKLVDMEMTSLLNAFRKNEIPIESLLSFFRTEHQSQYKLFVYDQITRAKKQYEDSKKKKFKHPIFVEMKMLDFCGRLGDQEAIQRLINIFETLDLDKSGFAMNSLMSIGSRKAMAAVLKRVVENIGAPFYDRGATRFWILKDFYRKFPRDPFFKKYSNFFEDPMLTDADIGGEQGVKELYRGLTEWAKKNLDLDLNLEGAELKIKLVGNSG